MSVQMAAAVGKRDDAAFRMPRPAAGVRHVACAAVLLAIVVVAVVGLIEVPRHTGARDQIAPAGQPTPVALPGSPSLQSAIRWTEREVPRSVPVLADRAVAGVLRARRYVDVLPTDFGAGDAPPAYVIASPALRAAAAHSPAVRQALGGSAPVARFGSGAAAVVIRQHVSAGAVAVARDRAADLRTRLVMERRLLADRTLVVAPAARDVLQRGGLDVRCATALALLARRGFVRLVAVPIDHAERAAGLPARVVVFRAGSAGSGAVLRMLSLPYRPASVRHLPGGAQRWTWPIRAVPLAASS